MSDKVMCANCLVMVNFEAFDITLADGTKLEKVVAVNPAGEYLCKDCMEVARKNPDVNACRLTPLENFVAAHHIKIISGMVMMAQDLLLQFNNNSSQIDYDEDFKVAVNEWLDTYKKFRSRTSGENDVD